ncbi:MAG: type II toxin-antitoxin system VapC family toxin [Gammaproteobacteria bacterium]|nr:type II toxin-antitoxin system VapC family toxin [Gammaproteobacteria bacterium]
MTTVVDASALVAALVDQGPDGRWASATLAADRAAAPELLLAETSSTLRQLERRGVLAPFEAAGAHQAALRLDVELFPFEPFATRTWELRHSLTVYDAWYVAVAEMVGGRLATLDRRMARADGPRCEIVVPPAPH